MAGLLGEIFSAGNVARRKLTDLLGNPLLSAQQFVGNLNDRARNLNELTAAAAQEGASYGPKSQQLAGLLAEAYNPVGMFIGPSSAMFNKDMALKASQMAKKGATPQEIWQTTGTVKGPDGQWRQEISDQGSFYRGSKAAGSSYAEDVHLHPELYKAYPQIGSSKVVESPHKGGSYNPTTRQIRVGPEDANSTMLHEQQHQIQDIEGFASGGTARDFAKMRDEADNKITELNEQMRSIVRFMDDPATTKQQKEALRSQYEDLIEQRQSLVGAAQIDPLQAYGNLMGEAEARLTQRRMNLSPEERLQNFPFQYTGETGYGLDVPLEGLIQMTPEGTIIRRGLLGQ